MKTLFMMLLALILTTSLGAQGGDNMDHCTLGADVTDNTCNDGRCASTTFTPACTDCNYDLMCEIIGSCNMGSLSCKATATLYRVVDGAIMGQCGNWDNSDCGYSGQFHPLNPVCLEEGRQYRLEVCFESCVGHPCTDCTNCVAHARISHG